MNTTITAPTTWVSIILGSIVLWACLQAFWPNAPTGQLLSPKQHHPKNTNPTTIVKNQHPTNDNRSNSNSNSNSNSTTYQIHALRFPYRKLPIGMQASCEWVPLWNHPNNTLLSTLLGHSPWTDMDDIQQAALEDTICIGHNPLLAQKLHLFSSHDALTCLQNSNVTLLIAGDSYNQQLFVGLAEILRGKPSSLEMTNASQRRDIVALSQQFLNAYLPSSTTSVQWICAQACHKYASHFAQSCSKCLKRHILQQPQPQQQHIIPIVGAFIHIYTAHHRDPDATWNELQAFFQNLHDHTLIFNSPPSFHKERIPIQYQDAMPADDENEQQDVQHMNNTTTTTSPPPTNSFVSKNPVYNRMVDELPQRFRHVRFLDFYPLTRSCRFANCSVDGGHRARFVNRWKAQLLLNTICEVEKI